MLMTNNTHSITLTTKAVSPFLIIDLFGIKLNKHQDNLVRIIKNTKNKRIKNKTEKRLGESIQC